MDIIFENQLDQIVFFQVLNDLVSSSGAIGRELNGIGYRKPFKLGSEVDLLQAFITLSQNFDGGHFASFSGTGSWFPKANPSTCKDTHPIVPLTIYPGKASFRMNTISLFGNGSNYKVFQLIRELLSGSSEWTHASPGYYCRAAPPSPRTLLPMTSS